MTKHWHDPALPGDANPRIAFALERAGARAARAQAARCPADRHDFADLERRWLALARSEQFAERLRASLKNHRPVMRTIKAMKPDFTIIEIAELAGVNPKIARKRLRIFWRREELAIEHTKWRRWLFPAADVSRVIAIIDPGCCAGVRWHKPLTPL
jgi:hypothetical protein